MNKIISIYHDINLMDVAEEISTLSEKDIKSFIKCLVLKDESFDFELDLILYLFNYLDLTEAIKGNKEMKLGNEQIRGFLLQLRAEIDKNLKEIDLNVSP